MANRSRVSLNRSNASSIKENSENVENEYFWSVVLNSEKRSVTWVVKSAGTDDEDEDEGLEHTLFLKAAVLGGSAIAGEQNIVVFQSPGEDGKTQKGTIANLTRGQNPMSPLDLTVTGRIGGTFTLSEGSGPVTIAGNHFLEFRDDGDVNDENQTDKDNTSSDEIDESDEDEEKPVGKGTKTKTGEKRKAIQTAQKQKQKAKLDVDEDKQNEDDADDYEENDDDDDDDEDYDVKYHKKAKKGKDTPNKLDKGKTKLDKDSGKKVVKAVKK